MIKKQIIKITISINLQTTTSKTNQNLKTIEKNDFENEKFNENNVFVKIEKKNAKKSIAKNNNSKKKINK